MVGESEVLFVVSSRSVTIPLNMEIAPNAELRAVSLRSVHLTAEVSGELLKLNGWFILWFLHLFLAQDD